MQFPNFPTRLAVMLGTVILLSGIQVDAETHSQDQPGQPVSTLGFSIDKMDLNADPGQDFYQFAAGHWVDGLVIPKDRLSLSSFDLLAKQNSAKLQQILEQAAANNANAPKGSPLQQVGDFFASGMDLDRLKALSVEPLQAMLDKIDTIDSPTKLARVLAEFSLTMSDPALFMAGVIPDIEDPAVYSVAVVVGALGMTSLEDYLNDDKKALRNAYLTYVADSLELMGIPAKDAAADARLVLEMERRIAARKLTPVESMVPQNRFTRMSMAELISLLPNLDVSTYMRTLGLPAQGEVIVMEQKALIELNKILEEYPLADIKTYLRWGMLRNTKGTLTPDFDASTLAYLQARYGDIEMPPRAEKVTASVPALFGHPLSQLYVEKYFTEDTKQRVTEIVDRITTSFRARLLANNWLSKPTRKAALEKIDRLVIDVGYPRQWIDYSGIDIRRDDFFGNTQRRNEMMARRDLAKLGKPVAEDDFSVAGATLPIDINAAYDSGRNKIEIPAAFLQPPIFDPDLDVAVNYCTLGAIIGHEITHGFDSSGRLYDATGNLRDWWTAEDTARFEAQINKLVTQANAYEVLPGLRLNGELTVTENLADVGGISMAYAGLQSYLQAHPEANRKIDGYTPQQRCFLAWAQTWAGKSREGYLRQITATDSHSVGPYRSIAAPAHVAGFFTAFDIKPGDAMWRAEQDRVKIW